MKSLAEYILQYPIFYRLLQFLGGGQRAQLEILRDIINFNKRFSVVDIGCGPADILGYLPDSVDYWGCDGEAKYIEYAKKKYNKGKFFVNVFGDTGDSWEGLPSFDYALALGVLHHLDDAEAISLLMFAAKLMKPTACLITHDLVRVPHQNMIARFLNDNDRGKYVRSQQDYLSLAKHVFTDVKQTVRSDLMRLPQDVLVMQCSGVR